MGTGQDTLPMADEVSELKLSIRVRPLRLGFLVNPDDARSVFRIFRLNACLWGSIYNPIIPHFDVRPSWWEKDRPIKQTAKQIMNRYLRYFEPDILVEAKKNLSANLNVADEFKTSLKKLFLSEDGKYKGPAIGLSVFEIIKDLYEKEYRFVQRHEKKCLYLFPSEGFEQFVAAVFGSYPTDKGLSYFKHNFVKALNADEKQLDCDVLWDVYERRHITPLDLGRHEIKPYYSGSGETKLFILDATNTRDLIEFWNYRSVKENVRAIPIQWIEELSDKCKDLIRRRHIPIPGNPSGMKFHTVVTYASSLDDGLRRQIFNDYIKIDSDEHPIWVSGLPRFESNDNDDYGPIEHRPILTHRTEEINAARYSSDSSIWFDAVGTNFDDRYSSKLTCSNIVDLAFRSEAGNVATVFPLTIDEPGFPDFARGNRVLSTREGLTVFPDARGRHQIWDLWDGREAFIRWFKRNHVSATLSSAGNVLLQIVEALGGLWGVRTIANEKVINLLNRMALSQVEDVSTENSPLTKTYSYRTAPVSVWHSLIMKLNEDDIFSNFKLQEFTDKRILELGMSLNCTHCEFQNWYSLTALNYSLDCERCLKQFPFPVDNPPRSDKSWHYRVIGPFSTPDYAMGAYACALSLHFFNNNISSLGDDMMTWTPSLDLITKQGKKLECDFAIWFQRTRILGLRDAPFRVFGEAKSFGKDSFTNEDIKRMRDLANLYPGSFFVFSTMKDKLSNNEIDIISKFALWGREKGENVLHRAQVIVLTGTELFASWNVSRAWEEKGGKHAQLAGHRMNLANLGYLAECTQQLYLRLSSYHEWFEEKWRKKRRSKGGRKK